jgi:cell division protein FtsQ
MASVRARRSGGRGRGRSAPKPVYGMPRMAMMKLEGAQRVAESFKAMGSRRNLSMMFASGIMIAGAAVAGAAWIGGSLVDARETMAHAADTVAVDAGFEAKTILVGGVGDARAAEVRAVAIPEGRASLFAATPAAVKERVEGLPWVEHVTVSRLWPSTVKIEVKRRQAYALWQHDGAMSVIDANGAPVQQVRWTDAASLPMVVGQDASATAHDMLLTLENMPSIRTRMSALVRVGDRRWNLKMKSGMYVALPEKDAPAALATLAGLQDRYGLLDRPLARIDLRVPSRLVVLPRDVLAGGPGLAGDERALASFATGA